MSSKEEIHSLSLSGHSGLIWLFLNLFTGSCVTDSLSVVEPGWNLVGLEGVQVNVIQPDGDGLLVGTEKGLYRWTENGLVNLGQQDHEIRGVVRLKDNDLLIGVRRTDANNPVIWKLQDEEKSWKPFMKNYGGEESLNYIYRLESTGLLSDTLYTRGCGAARSTNGGQNWEPFSGRWNCGAGLETLLYIDPFHPGRIWIGGVTGISRAYLFKGSDYGSGDWINVTDGLSDHVEAIAYDVMTHPEDPDKVLVGLSGVVKKSTDGGKNWELALGTAGVHSFARSLVNPDRIYASGRDVSTQLFFVSTTDFGETWEKEIFEEGPSVVTTNDLAVMEIGGREVLFLATDHGLYSYTMNRR
jgi:hypothetical protein